MRGAAAGCAALLLLAGAARADREYVVQPGESLWQIAAILTGDPTRWPELYRANRDQIKDPARLYPGQRLAIPEFETSRAGAAPPVSAAPRRP